MTKSFIGKDGFIWWKGVVEDRKDPLFLGRVRVRIFGWHTDNIDDLPSKDLPWAMPSLPIDNGKNPVGLKEGDWVWGFFLDNSLAQKPIVVGYIPGIDSEKANPKKGFSDPTSDEDLNELKIPRPPDMIAIKSEENLEQDDDNDESKPTGKYADKNRLPGTNTVFGELLNDYLKDPTDYRLDVDNNGVFDDDDLEILLEKSIKENTFFDGQVKVLPTTPVSRYPLENRLNEPSTSRLSRNEKIEETIVELKKQDIMSGVGSGYISGGAADTAIQPVGFVEPETPYNALYPYNHVYESESGHVIEVDDTPGSERMHWYHRSGTFTEIHPNGIEVNKIKNSQYNFIIKDYFNYTEGNVNFHSLGNFRLRCESNVVLNCTSNFNQEVGGSLNQHIKQNKNTKITKDQNVIVDGVSRTHIGGDTYLYVKDGVLHIKAKGNVLIESDDKMQLVSNSELSLISKKIILSSGATGDGIHLDGKVYGEVPIPIADRASSLDNNADDEDWYTEPPTEVSSKYGFLFSNGSDGDVWKPESDSDGRLVIITKDAKDGKAVVLCEAIPTPELEAVRIIYQHINGTFTEWQVVRPVHKLGEEIARSTNQTRKPEIFEDGKRWLHRFNSPGGEYPKQLFWFPEGEPEKARLIMESSERHQTATLAPYNMGFVEKIPMTL